MPSPELPAPTDSFSPSESRRSALIAAGVLVLVPSLYSFRFMSFSHPKLAGFALGAGLLACMVTPERVWDRGRARLFAPLLVLVLWAGVVDAMHVENFWQSAGLGAGASYLVLLVAALVLLAAAPGLTLQRALVVSCIPVGALALAQYAHVLPGMFPAFPSYDQRVYSVFGNQDLLGGYLAIGLALGTALWLKGMLAPWAMIATFVTAFPALLLSGSRSAWLAAVLGCGVAAWQGRAPRSKLGTAGLAALLIAVVVLFAAPQATWHRVAGTFAHGDVGYRIRMWIWDGTAHLISQHPIAGVGLGNFAYRSPLAQGEVLHARGPGVHMFNHISTEHAHSDVLEIAAEAGVVGVVLLLVFLALIPRTKSPAWAGLIAAFVFSLINTTLHSPPHVLAVLLLAGSMVEPRADAARSPLGAFERRAQGILLALALVGLAYVVFDPSRKHARAQNLYDAGKHEAALAAYRDAAYLPGNHAAAYEYSVALANAGHNQDAITAANYAARGVDTADLYYLRAYLAERVLPMRTAADNFRECLKRWPDHRLAYEGLIRTSGPSERAAVLAEAERWLSQEDYAGVMGQPSAPR